MASSGLDFEIFDKATRPLLSRLIAIKDTGYLRIHCRQENLITANEYQELQTLNVARQHNEKLMIMLSGGSSKNLKTFIKILRGDSTHRYDGLADALCTEAVKYDRSFENAGVSPRDEEDLVTAEVFSGVDGTAYVSKPLPSESSQNILHKKEPILIEIGEHFFSRSKVDKLATHLLHDVPPLYGPDFVLAMVEKLPRDDWPYVATEVLRKWCSFKQDTATLDVLLTLLEDMGEVEIAKTYRSRRGHTYSKQ